MSALEYVNPIYNALRIVSKDRTPRQLALAVALGMMIGLLPKGNLLAAGFTFLLLTLRVNLGVGLTTAFLVTLCSGTIDPLTHGIGLRMLRNPSVYPLLSELHQLPVVPWMSLNNTVVLGSFILGIGLFYPTYHGSERAFQRLVPALHSRFGKPSDESAPATASPSIPGNSAPKPTLAEALAAANARAAVAQPVAASAPTSSLAPADLMVALGDPTAAAQARESAALTRPPLMTRAMLPTRKLASAPAAADRLRRAMPLTSPPEPSPESSSLPRTHEGATGASPFASLLPPGASAGSPSASPRDPARDFPG